MTSIGNRFLRAALAVLVLGCLQTGCQKGEGIEGNNQQNLVTSKVVLREDMDYMRRLADAAPGGAVKLDLSDDIQYRFIRSRLAASGKTPEKAPQFFTMLEAMRQKHLAARNSEQRTQLSTTVAKRDHVIGDFTVLPDGATFEVTAFSTIQDGSDYSFVDVVLWDEAQGAQLSDYGWGETYGDGRKLKARATGPMPVGSDGVFFTDSVSLVSINGVDESVYVAHNVKTAPGATVFHPYDTNSDKIVTICLDRSYKDCDYPMVGKREVQIPIKGSITFPFEVASIVNGPNTHVKLVEEGGGPREMAMATSTDPHPFYNFLQINPADKRQVTWDVPQSSGIFQGILFQRYEDVDFFLSVEVNLKRPGRNGATTTLAAVKIGSVGSAISGGVPLVPKIQIVYSCLAEGTEIRMANGKTVKVEDITHGSKVLANASGLGLDVVDTSVGIERIPMVRLVDDAGHNLLLTTSHPVVTPERGVVWAEELKAGQKVVTESGVRTLVKADREMFHGKVYNLKLDTSSIAQPEFAKGSAMFANGFRVGDLAMQRALEFKNSEDFSANLLARLPSKWHTDYLNSLKSEQRTARP